MQTSLFCSWFCYFRQFFFLFSQEYWNGFSQFSHLPFPFAFRLLRFKIVFLILYFIYIQLDVFFLILIIVLRFSYIASLVFFYGNSIWPQIEKRFESFHCIQTSRSHRFVSCWFWRLIVCGRLDVWCTVKCYVNW